jgi:hypothetical protein
MAIEAMTVCSNQLRMRLRRRDDNNRINSRICNRLFDICKGGFSIGEDFAALGSFSIRVGNFYNAHAV